MSLTSEDKEWFELLLSRKPDHAQLDAKLNALETRVNEAIERVETNLLTAFH